MEAIKENIQDIVPNPTSLRELSLKYKDRLLTNINADYFILALGVTLSAITSVMFYNYITSKRKNSIKDEASKEAIEPKEDGTKVEANDGTNDGEKKKTNLDEFKERINKEWEDWFSWVKVKDNIFINFILNDWLDWKDDNYAMFSEWMELFVKKWINEKQWTVWEQEKGNAQIQKESPCSLVNNEQSS
ncbi:tryptophan-rich antigen [Plasmodium malariae]|uniref:Tryptophan-rich antigen n=1 Tax=Plasmodium malariae TaxID=5858 RepID=A0A1C3KM61_PLAMA|nr:tryptophan-rich antigen [Plasmodium malariae]